MVQPGSLQGPLPTPTPPALPLPPDLPTGDATTAAGAVAAAAANLRGRPLVPQLEECSRYPGGQHTRVPHANDHDWVCVHCSTLKELGCPPGACNSAGCTRCEWAARACGQGRGHCCSMFACCCLPRPCCHGAAPCNATAHSLPPSRLTHGAGVPGQFMAWQWTDKDHTLSTGGEGRPEYFRGGWPGRHGPRGSAAWSEIQFFASPLVTSQRAAQYNCCSGCPSFLQTTTPAAGATRLPQWATVRSAPPAPMNAAPPARKLAAMPLSCRLARAVKLHCATQPCCRRPLPCPTTFRHAGRATLSAGRMEPASRATSGTAQCVLLERRGNARHARLATSASAPAPACPAWPQAAQCALRAAPRRARCASRASAVAAAMARLAGASRHDGTRALPLPPCHPHSDFATPVCPPPPCPITNLFSGEVITHAGDACWRGPRSSQLHDPPPPQRQHRSQLFFRPCSLPC